MPGVIIETSEALPEHLPLIAEFGPGFIHMIMRAGLSQAETVREIEAAWQGIRDHYGADRIKRLEAAS